MNNKFNKIILLYAFLLLFQSCNQGKNNEKKTYKDNNYEMKKFEFKKKIPDTSFSGRLHKNYLYLDTERIDSIYRETNIDDELKKREKFLFVYVFNNQEILPKSVDQYNEDNGDVYISEYDNDTIEFYYSFKKKGWNKLTLITLDQLRFPSIQDTSKFRFIEDKYLYIDSVFVR